MEFELENQLGMLKELWMEKRLDLMLEEKLEILLEHLLEMELVLDMLYKFGLQLDHM